jgi:hypothetical protein
MGLSHARLERCFDEIQLRAGQRSLERIEALNGLSDPDNRFEHLAGPGDRRSKELPGARIDWGCTGRATRLVELRW